MVTRSPQTARWLWHAAWLALGLTLLVSITGALVLGAGAADPPRAGSLMWEEPTHPIWDITARQSLYDLPDLPPPPFTIEVVARFSGDTPASSAWTLSYQPVMRRTPMRLSVYGNGLLRAWRLPAIPFIHLRPNGEFNQLSFDVHADYSATIRINDEIAWQGPLDLDSVTPDSGSWWLSARPGTKASAEITWARIAIYAPAKS